MEISFKFTYLLHFIVLTSHLSPMHYVQYCINMICWPNTRGLTFIMSLFLFLFIMFYFFLCWNHTIANFEGPWVHLFIFIIFRILFSIIVIFLVREFICSVNYAENNCMSIDFFSCVNIQMMCSTYFKIKVSGLQKDKCFFLTFYFA